MRRQADDSRQLSIATVAETVDRDAALATAGALHANLSGLTSIVLIDAGRHWGALSTRSPEASAIVCRFVNRTTLLIAMTCVLAACGTQPAAATQLTPSAASSPAHSPATCASGYAETSPTINLANDEDGESVTVHLCTAIWVVLRPDDRGSDWQFVQSSDSAVLAVVPLPLPFILGGVESVYLAERVGNAQLSSSPPIASCPPNAMCLPQPRWMVTVAVVP